MLCEECGEKNVEPGLDLCNECDLFENPPTKRFLWTWEKMVALVRRINQYIKNKDYLVLNEDGERQEKPLVVNRKDFTIQQKIVHNDGSSFGIVLFGWRWSEDFSYKLAAKPLLKWTVVKTADIVSIGKLVAS